MFDFPVENKSSWEKIRESGLPVVLYGTGNGADKVLNEFEKLSVPVLGAAASDEFVRDRFFRGFRVRKLSEFTGDFIIAVAFASRIPEVMDRIYSLGGKRRVLVPVAPVVGDEIFNSDFAAAHRDEIKAAYELFTDDSKRVFAGCVSFNLGGELETLKKITTEKSEAFGSFFKLDENESYLDIGAYKGADAEEFLRFCSGKYESLTALEPDPKSYKKLCEFLAGVPRSEAIRKAAYDVNGIAPFRETGGRQAALSPEGRPVETATVDSLRKNRRTTYIKIDAEGAEKKIIDGAKEVIKNQKPKLNIALYHRSEDIFSIPLQIARINSDYEFHLRRHPYIPCWDANLYCV